MVAVPKVLLHEKNKLFGFLKRARDNPDTIWKHDPRIECIRYLLLTAARCAASTNLLLACTRVCRERDEGRELGA